MINQSKFYFTDWWQKWSFHCILLLVIRLNFFQIFKWFANWWKWSIFMVKFREDVFNIIRSFWNNKICQCHISKDKIFAIKMLFKILKFWFNQFLNLRFFCIKIFMIKYKLNNFTHHFCKYTNKTCDSDLVFYIFSK